ncbi:MAG: dockerin type I repeat-containing protein [Oscillospiraceae bacterium]|nr:dockerin type I repeat-containing protein [Oscillospiraceae bacterium]
MKKIKFISAATASVFALCSLFPNVMINSSAEESYYLTIEEFTGEDYIRVESGNIYDDTIAAVNYGDTSDYNIYVHSDGKNVSMKSYAFIPEYKYADFIISETADVNEAWDTIKPILSKYSSFTCDSTEAGVKQYRRCCLKKNDNQSDEAFISETESLMKELKNTGYVFEFYPPGSLNHVILITGNFEFLGASESRRDILSEYINENLPNYDFSEDGWLIPDSSLTLQERFDVAQKIYEDTGIKAAFATIDVAYDEVGDSIILLEDFLIGDANGDDELNVSDAAFIARTLAKRETIDVTANPAADYNNDGKVTVSDAATIARDLAKIQ